MATVKQNEITFSKHSFGINLPGKYGNTDPEDYELTGEFEPFVNAVEIDWNGASICNQTVNTTGQLL